MATDWAADVKKYVANADDAAIAGIVRYCGIALRNKDSSLVAFSDKTELDRVRNNFLKKKLGLTQSDATLDKAIAKVGEVMKADRTKNRVTVYYLLAAEFKKLGLFVKKAAAEKAKAPAAKTTAAKAPAEKAPAAKAPAAKAPAKKAAAPAKTAAKTAGAAAAVAGAAGAAKAASKKTAAPKKAAAPAKADAAPAAKAAAPAKKAAAAPAKKAAAAPAKKAAAAPAKKAAPVKKPAAAKPQSLMSKAADTASDAGKAGSAAVAGTVAAVGAAGAAAVAAASGGAEAVKDGAVKAVDAVGDAAGAAAGAVTGAAGAAADKATALFSGGGQAASSDDEGSNLGWLLWLFGIGLAIFLLWWFLGRSVDDARPAPADAPTEAAASASPGAAPEAAVDLAAAPVEGSVAIPAGEGVTSELREGKPVVKVYFASGKVDVAQAFTPAASGLKAWLDKNPGSSLAISGYADPSGNAAQNAEFAKQRAQAVQAALIGAGVPEASAKLVKPDDVTDANVAKDAARRVEVVVK